MSKAAFQAIGCCTAQSSIERIRCVSSKGQPTNISMGVALAIKLHTHPTSQVDNTRPMGSLLTGLLVQNRHTLTFLAIPGSKSLLPKHHSGLADQLQRPSIAEDLIGGLNDIKTFKVWDTVLTGGLPPLPPL